MRKKVLITDNPERAKKFWESLYPSLKKWELKSENLNYQEAQELENYYAMMRYEKGPSATYISGNVWFVYTFEY